jgi:DNA-binding transcriptional regulator YiaG
VTSHDSRRSAALSLVRQPLSERFSQLRFARNFSQSEAALKLQISKRTLQEWEQRRAEPEGLGAAKIGAGRRIETTRRRA